MEGGPAAGTPPWLGVLMLDTRFPRPPGDIGNPATFAALGIPVRYLKVQGADPERVVREGDPRLLQPFIAAAQTLVAQGAAMLATSCGFLAMFQQELQAAVRVPVLSSSLLWLGQLAQDEPQERPAVLTIDAAALGPRHLAGVAAPGTVPVDGVQPGCEFQRRILGNDSTLDLAQAEQDVVAAARQLVQAHPAVTTLVLECTNMPPYADAVRAATGRRVEHLVSLVAQQWRGLGH